MTPDEATRLRGVMDGCDAAMAALEADLEQLMAAFDAGISLDVIGFLNRIAMESRHERS